MRQGNRVTRSCLKPRRPRFGTMDKKSTDSRCTENKPRCRFLFLRLFLLTLAFVIPAHHTHHAHRPSALVMNALFLTRRPAMTLKPLENMNRQGVVKDIVHSTVSVGEDSLHTVNSGQEENWTNLNLGEKDAENTQNEVDVETIISLTKNITYMGLIKNGTQSMDKGNLGTIPAELKTGLAKNVTHLIEEDAQNTHHDGELEAKLEELPSRPVENVSTFNLIEKLKKIPELHSNLETLTTEFIVKSDGKVSSENGVNGQYKCKETAEYDDYEGRLKTIDKHSLVRTTNTIANESVKEHDIRSTEPEDVVGTAIKEASILPSETMPHDNLMSKLRDTTVNENIVNTENEQLPIRPLENLAVENWKKQVLQTTEPENCLATPTKKFSSCLEAQNVSLMTETYITRTNGALGEGQGVISTPPTVDKSIAKKKVPWGEGNGIFKLIIDSNRPVNISSPVETMRHTDSSESRDSSNFNNTTSYIETNAAYLQSISQSKSSEMHVDISSAFTTSSTTDKGRVKLERKASSNDPAREIHRIDAYFTSIATPNYSTAHTIANKTRFVPKSNITTANKTALGSNFSKRPSSTFHERLHTPFTSINTQVKSIYRNKRSPRPINTSERSYVHKMNWLTMNSSNPSLSCRNRCGLDANFPCSCDDKCVVHRTCCEDLAQSCPELYSQALTKFRHLLHASVRCDEISAVHMVESCPSEQQTAGNEYPPENPKGEDRGKMVSLSEILSNAPVTDLHTGIIYANATVYNCNNKQGPAFNVSETLESPVALWYTQMGTRNNNAPSRIQDVNKVLDLSTFSFIPPRSEPAVGSVSSLCYGDETVACIAMLANQTGAQDLVCNNTVVNYFDTRGDYLTLSLKDFKNTADKICPVCLSDYQKTIGFRDRFLLTGFKVLMSFSEISGQVVYDLPQDVEENLDGAPWWSWTCNMSRQPETFPATQPMTEPMTQAIAQSDLACNVLACDPRFLKTADGICREVVEAEFSIQTELVSEGKTCSIASEVFITALRCFLDSMYKLKATDEPFRIYQENSSRANVTLTTVRMHMYFDSDKNTYYSNLVANYFTLYSIMLVFAQQNCLLEEERVEWGTFTAQNLIQLLSRQIPSGGVLRVTNHRGKQSMDMESPQMKSILDRFIFTVCLLLGQHDQSLDDEIDCSHSSERNFGLTTVDIDGLVAQLNALNCFNKSEVVSETQERVNQKAGVANTIASCIILYLHVVITLLSK
ncbi:hypothetical protein EGW08_009431 [Elysia chlorotica]|uniref:SMB domain-containing protein n=1 Tax=Elysia chlorotica TaxID=188477 RepID=A0A3S1BG17_ELYCH|nr:hypothetical protein EGW08_009431 [Elysia chlorotica]